MKKTYTLQLIDSAANFSKKCETIIANCFDKVEKTTSLYETFEYYHHYKPDVIILSSSHLYDEYEPFLKKVKKNYSTPVIILIEPKEIMSIASALNYNFTYAIRDEDFEQNLLYCVSEALLKVKLIEKMLIGYNQKFSTLEKNKAVIENSKVPMLITTGHIDKLKCNRAFLDHFCITQKEVNKKLEDSTFIDSVELKKILKKGDLTKHQDLKIAGKTYECKIYILQKYELYLVTFETLFSKNKLIDMDLRKELETLLHRLDKNFDDYVKLQYNMIELSTEIKGFLSIDTEKSLIDEWLISNKKVVEALEKEFDSNILQELKIHFYMNK